MGLICLIKKIFPLHHHPLYNKLKRIERNVLTLTNYLQAHHRHEKMDSIEIIYVDDGSTDDTVNQLKMALSKVGIKAKTKEADVTFRFLRPPHNQGKGAAIQELVKMMIKRLLNFCSPMVLVPKMK